MFCCCPKKINREIDEPLIAGPANHPQPIARQSGIKPNFAEENHIPRHQSQLVIIEPTQTNRKPRNQIWENVNQSQILYYNFEEEKQCYVSYLLIKKQSNLKKTLREYLVKKCNDQFNLFISNSKRLLHHHSSQFTINDANFTFITLESIKKPDEKIDVIQTQKSVIELEHINQIRINMFDNIYICLERELSSSQMYELSLAITSNFTLEQLCRVCYIFPTSITIQEISIIIAKRIKKYIINGNLDQILNLLNYEIELVGHGEEQYVIVSNNKEDEVNKCNLINIAIGILMFDTVEEFNWRMYTALIQNLRQEKLNRYLKLKKDTNKTRKHPNKFSEVLLESNFINNDDLHIIQRDYHLFKKIHPYISTNEQEIIVVSRQLKDKVTQIVLGDIERQRNNTPLKKQWDDDLKKYEIPVPPKKDGLHGSLNDHYQENPLNLDSLGEKEIEDVNLGDEEEKVMDGEQINYEINS